MHSRAVPEVVQILFTFVIQRSCKDDNVLKPFILSQFCMSINLLIEFVGVICLRKLQHQYHVLSLQHSIRRLY